MLVQLRAAGLDSVVRGARAAGIVGRGHGGRVRVRGAGETDADDGQRQHVRPVHVLEAVRVRGRRVPVHGAHVRRDILGHQPGLRGGLHAVAASVLRGPPEKTVRLVGSHQTLHHGNGRLGEEHVRDRDVGRRREARRGRRRRRRRLGSERFYRRAADELADRTGPEHGPRDVRARGLHRRSLGRRQSGHARAIPTGRQP